MYTIKDLAAWYKMHPNSMRRNLVREGVIPSTDKGSGNRKRLALRDLKPFLDKYGYPKEITLSLTPGSQLTLFQ